MMVLHSVHDGRHFTEENWRRLEDAGAAFEVREGWIWIYLPRRANNG